MEEKKVDTAENTVKRHAGHDRKNEQDKMKNKNIYKDYQNKTKTLGPGSHRRFSGSIISI